MKLKLSVIAGMLFLSHTLLAQIDTEMKEFDNFIKQQQQDFEDFVDEQNKEFVKFLKENWKEYNLEQPIARPQRPEPMKPIYYDKKRPIVKPQELKVGEVMRMPIPVVTPSTTYPSSVKKTPIPAIIGQQVASPYVKPENPTTKPNSQKKPARKPETKPVQKPAERPITSQPSKPDRAPVEDEPMIKKAPITPLTTRSTHTGMKFDFYGENYAVNGSLKNHLVLNGIAEKDISNGWETLSRSNYQNLIEDCLVTKRETGLNDYGYLLLTKKVAAELCGSNRINEIALMQMFILCQSGYKAKVARVGNHLGVFYASDDLIYGTSFLTLNGTKYYKFGTSGSTKEAIYTYSHDFANSKNLVNMSLTSPQSFTGIIKRRNLQAKAYPAVKVSAEVSSDLIAFYKDYPQCDFSVYVGAPVSREVEQTVLPLLRQAIQEKKQSEAANILINFVQTAFAYKTDDEQFGYEKPFFVDEVFYYPYCDCEDRAILFNYLVRTLLGVDAVLLDYPNHIATAICFDESVNGDYIILDGKKYIICDPTYIGASIGEAMPQFKNLAAKVLKY